MSQGGIERIVSLNIREHNARVEALVLLKSYPVAAQAIVSNIGEDIDDVRPLLLVNDEPLFDELVHKLIVCECGRELFEKK